METILTMGLLLILLLAPLFGPLLPQRLRAIVAVPQDVDKSAGGSPGRGGHMQRHGG